jgi:hypothetical protein
MRKVRLWLASALVAALVVGSSALGDPQGGDDRPAGGKKGGFGGKKGSKGAFARDGKGGFAQDGKGKGKGGPGRGADNQGGRGDRPGPGGPGGFTSAERALDELKLTDKKFEKAETIVKGYEENVRKLMDLAKSDLLIKLKDVLSEQELKTFTAAIERRPGGPGDRGPGPGGPGRRGGPGGRGPGAGRGLTADQIIERLMSFDKNKDGKISKDELPERMHRLIEMGDTNKDGVLDKDEIKALAAKLEKEGFAAFADGGGRGGRGPGGFGGFGGRGPGGAGGAAVIDRALEDLKLTDKKKEKAEAVVKAHHESVRKLMDLAKSDLLVKMKDVLSETELKTFTTALDRRPDGPGAGFRGPRGPGRGPGADRRPEPSTDNAKTAELEKKLDQIMKELEALRREIKR